MEVLPAWWAEGGDPSQWTVAAVDARTWCLGVQPTDIPGRVDVDVDASTWTRRRVDVDESTSTRRRLVDGDASTGRPLPTQTTISDGT